MKRKERWEFRSCDLIKIYTYKCRAAAEADVEDRLEEQWGKWDDVVKLKHVNYHI